MLPLFSLLMRFEKLLGKLLRDVALVVVVEVPKEVLVPGRKEVVVGGRVGMVLLLVLVVIIGDTRVLVVLAVELVELLGVILDKVCCEFMVVKGDDDN